MIFHSCSSISGKRKDTGELLTVTKVVDGDTFWAGRGATRVKVRLIGVDAPESASSFHKKVGYFGMEAKNYLKGLVEGKQVKLVCDIDSLDHYGRTLAYVYLPDGTFVNANLVKYGYATVMTISPNVHFADDFIKLQLEAREHNRGLWGIPARK